MMPVKSNYVSVVLLMECPFAWFPFAWCPFALHALLSEADRVQRGM